MGNLGSTGKWYPEFGPGSAFFEPARSTPPSLAYLELDQSQDFLDVQDDLALLGESDSDNDSDSCYVQLLRALVPYE